MINTTNLNLFPFLSENAETYLKIVKRNFLQHIKAYFSIDYQNTRILSFANQEEECCIIDAMHN